MIILLFYSFIIIIFTVVHTPIPPPPPLQQSTTNNTNNTNNTDNNNNNNANSTTVDINELKVTATILSENAMTELNLIRKSELTDFKAISKPPSLIVTTFQLVSMFLGFFQRKESWNRIMGVVVFRPTIITEMVSYINRIMNNEIQLSTELYEEFKASELYSVSPQQYERLGNAVRGFYLALYSIIKWYEYYQILSTTPTTATTAITELSLINSETPATINQKESGNEEVNSNENNTKQSSTNDISTLNFLTSHLKKVPQQNYILLQNCDRCALLITEHIQRLERTPREEE